jgi:exonuclease SbcD
MKKTAIALLINDIHVSKDNIFEFQANWDEALAICEKRNIPEIIVGGDLWQSRSAQTLSTLMVVRHAIIKATKAGLDITLAEGNHDLVDQESILGYSHLFSEYPNVYVIDDYAALDYGDNTVLYVMSYFPENGSFTQRLQDMIAKDLDRNKYNVLYIHEGINGALSTPCDKELPVKIFKDFDSVLVGHYHDRCQIKGTNIEYIGASRQHNFGEDEEKGYTILYSDGSYEFVKNQANIRYKVIDIPLSKVNTELLDELNRINKNGKYKIKTRISCTSGEVSTIDKQQLLEAGVSKVELIVTDHLSPDGLETQKAGFESKFDKAGIKQEYTDFCEKKEILNVGLGFKYLDKIN